MPRNPLEAAEPAADAETPDSLYRRIERGDPVTILDVRSRAEFEEWHISGPSVEIENVPNYFFFDEDMGDVLERLPDAEDLVVVCGEGNTSALIAGWLADQGYSAVNLEAGMEGWARVLVSTPITGYEGSGTLLQYQRPSSGCLGYLLYDEGEAAVFDPLRAFIDTYLEESAALDASLEYAVDTHVHADHVSGVRELAAEGITGIVPERAVERGITYADDVTAVADGDTFTVGSATVEAVHTPGHTTDMTSYLIDGSVLLTGDTIFTESVARPDLEEGDEGAPDAARQLYETIQDRIARLPDETIIAGGHASESAEPASDGTYTATLGDLKERLPVFGMDRETFVETVLADMPPRPANYRRIIAANLGQEDIDPEEAFELELGPNNCATSQGALT